jgi:hypothetical protein
VRALLFANDARRCPDAWAEQMAADLRKAALPPEGLERWLDELDHPRFPVRERATRELQGLDPRFVSRLRQALGEPRSLEAKRRLERILPHHAGAEVPALIRRALAHLAESRSTAGAVVLDVVYGVRFPNGFARAVREALRHSGQTRKDDPRDKGKKE